MEKTTDKARVFITYNLGAAGAILSYHDSFWWMVLKIVPFCLAAVIIEMYRSARQNEENLEE